MVAAMVAAMVAVVPAGATVASISATTIQQCWSLKAVAEKISTFTADFTAHGCMTEGNATHDADAAVVAALLTKIQAAEGCTTAGDRAALATGLAKLAEVTACGGVRSAGGSIAAQEAAKATAAWGTGGGDTSSGTSGDGKGSSSLALPDKSVIIIGGSTTDSEFCCYESFPHSDCCCSNWCYWSAIYMGPMVTVKDCCVDGNIWDTEPSC